MNADLAEMRAEGEQMLAAEGFAPEAQEFAATINLRYEGQEHSVTLPIEGHVDAAEVERLKEAFDAAHERSYGHTMPDPIEVVAVRMSAIGRQDPPSLPVLAKGDGQRGFAPPEPERHPGGRVGRRVRRLPPRRLHAR